MGVAVEDQLLKSPAMLTLRASGSG